MSRIIAGQPVPVPRVADLPSEAASEKEEFESEAIKSLVLVPLMHAGSALGFLGLDSVRAERDWSEDTITLLTIVAETFANALVHKRAEAEREQLLEQVQEQARRVERIIHAVPAGVLLLDSNSRVILANPPGEQQLADLADAAVGDTIAALGDRQLSELLAPPPEGLWHELAGATRSYEAIARQMGVEPAPAEWVVVLRDVTEQIEVERRVQQHERLATVGQMAAGMAHDFNNIMAVIILYADMSLRTGEVPEPVLNRLETIKQQAGRASHLIDQMLDFSRRAVLERGPLDLRAFVEEQARLLRRTLPENIRIDVSFGDGDFVVNADPTRMQQAVLNLATNARDAMPDGGTLDFRLERQAVGPDAPPPLPELREGEWVCLTIGDTGTGIAEDVRPKVFEPFFTTKPPGLGTGLGLSQVYGIVMQHEGEIALRDRTGPGTEFRIYLPSTPIDRQSAAHAGEADAPLGSRETILLVEDNEAARAALAGTLALLNYEVVEAASGSEALEYYKARSADIDLVLTDVVMPEMGGPALVRALRDYEPRVRVVMVTGHPLGRESAEKLAALGIRNYVQKPASIEQLATAVAEALAGSSSE